MTSLGLTNTDLDLIRDAVQQFWQVEQVVIFGSRAAQTYHKGSDIDLAVFGPKINSRTISRLYDRLENDLPIPYFFDLIHYDTLANQTLKTHIQKEGILIYPIEKLEKN